MKIYKCYDKLHYIIYNFKTKKQKMKYILNRDCMILPCIKKLCMFSYNVNSSDDNYCILLSEKCYGKLIVALKSINIKFSKQDYDNIITQNHNKFCGYLYQDFKKIIKNKLDKKEKLKAIKNEI